MYLGVIVCWLQLLDRVVLQLLDLELRARAL
jgi:hypothetical protein